MPSPSPVGLRAVQLPDKSPVQNWASGPLWTKKMQGRTAERCLETHLTLESDGKPTRSLSLDVKPESCSKVDAGSYLMVGKEACLGKKPIHEKRD